RTCDDRGELTRVGQDQSKQGATLLFRSTEAQRVFRQRRATMDATGLGRFCTRRCNRSLRKQGPRNVWARHARYTDALHEAVKALGMEMFSRDGVHSVTVTGVLTPQGLDNKTVLAKLLHEHGVVISGGQGKMTGKMWRWGTMGAISEADMIAALGVLGRATGRVGYGSREGAAVNAALDVFSRAGKKQLVGVS